MGLLRRRLWLLLLRLLLRERLRVVRRLRRVRHGGRVLLLLEGQVRAAAR